MRVQLEKRGVLGAGQVKKGGSLPRHIPMLNIYVSTPPPPRDIGSLAAVKKDPIRDELGCLPHGGHPPP